MEHLGWQHVALALFFGVCLYFYWKYEWRKP